MKKIIVLCFAFLAVSLGSVYAQEKTAKEIMKERKEIAKLSRSALNDKATKDARKEAKKLAKQGWQTAPGALPLAKQLDKSYLMQYEYDEDGYPKFMMGEAMSTGENYDGAKIQALELAKQNMAGQIQTEITALVENQVANSQLTAEEASTVTKSVMASKNLISQSIGRVITIVEAYRQLPNKNKEVLVRIAYNSEMAKKVAKDAVRKSLEEETKSTKDELDKLLRTRSAQNQKLRSQQSALQKKLRDLSARAKSISELMAGVGSSEMSSDSRFSVRKLNKPVRGRVVVHFAEKTALGLKSDGWRIRVRGDALVMAPADGQVKFADNFKGFGKVIIMSHKNGYNTVMTNLGEINVMLGQEVLAGEPIGRMDPDKAEMYLEVRRGNKAVNPAQLFREDD